MRVLKTLNPGEPGTLRFQIRFKERLVCVRYREDKNSGKRYTTVEVIVASRPIPSGSLSEVDLVFSHPNKHVLVHTKFEEQELITRIRKAGGKWLHDKMRWKISLKKVLELGLEDRIESLDNENG